MKFITNVYYTLHGKDYVIPFITEVDESQPTYKQCQEASEKGKKLLEQHVPKNKDVKNPHYRTLEVGVRSLVLI